MRNRGMGKWILRLSLLAAVWLAAVDSLAESQLKADLSVEVDKSPRKKTYTREYIDDEEIDTEKDIDTYITSETYTLDITVSSSSEEGGDCLLEWYFIAGSVKGEDGAWTDELKVVSNGRQELSLNGKASVMKTAQYDFVLQEKYTQGTYDVDRDPDTGRFPEWARDGKGVWIDGARKGEKYEGYVVLVTATGEIIASDSNSDRFLKDKWIEKCRLSVGARRRKPDNINWRDLYNKWW